MATKQGIINHIDKTVESLANVAKMVPGGVVPEEAVALAPMAAEAYRLIRDIMDSGQDPADVIARMREARVWLEESEADWRKAMDAKFGGKS